MGMMGLRHRLTLLAAFQHLDLRTYGNLEDKANALLLLSYWCLVGNGWEWDYC